MRSIVLNLILTVCCFACGTNTTDQKKEIADSRAAFNLAIAKHDTSEMVKYWTDEIVVVTSRNTRFVGKDQYASGLGQEFAAKPDVVYIRTPETIEIFSSWEMAAETGRWLGAWKSNDEKIEVTGTYYAKWKKVNEQWLITAEVYTPLRCSGGSYCEEVPK
jgi:ketosteroid isomerase-like protein